MLFADNLDVDRIDIHNYIDFSITEKKHQWVTVNTNDKNMRMLKEMERFSQEKIRARVNLPLVFKKGNFCKKCEWFFKNLCFDAQGNVSSCGRVINPNSNYGNLFIDKDDIWNNGYMRRMRNKFLNKNEQLLICCRHCVENYQ